MNSKSNTRQTLAARGWLILLCLLFLTGGASGAVNGTFTVTERWTVRLEYTDFADGYTGTKNFSGTQSGTIRITNGSYEIIDRTGVAWSAPGQNQDLKERFISLIGSSYDIEGDYVFAPAYGANAYGLVFLGCFAVRVAFIDGELPAFYRFDRYDAFGPASEIEGGGNMIGSSLKAYVSSTISLREVVGKPEISQQPQSQTVYEGQSVTFSVAAGGSGPLGYFWRKGSTMLPGANGTSLTLTNLQLSDAGSYSVIVSNAGGTVTSSTAKLTVKPPGAPWFESWESASMGSHTPAGDTVVSISGDKGRWVLGDTVSFFDDCGPPLNHADIVSENGRKLLKLTSVDSQSGCADNISVSIDRRTSSSFPIPLVQNVQISFFEQGFMSNPTWNGTFNCVAPPCGDTVGLTLLDNLGNRVVYIFQRAPNYVEHTGIGYTEIFLDTNGGSFTRNLFADFARINGAGSVGTTIEGIEFGISADGWATLDDMLIGSTSASSDGVLPRVAITSPRDNTRLTNDTVTFEGTASDNAGVVEVEYQVENTGGLGEYQPATGTIEWSATISNLMPGPNTIRVRSRDVVGNLSTEETRTVDFVVVSPFTLLSTGAGTVTPDLDGQSLEVGQEFTLTAKPADGFVFSNWTSDLPISDSPKLTFTMQSNLTLTANFVPNPFPEVAGTYNGLFFAPDEVEHGSSGFFTATVRPNGAYSGALLLGGTKLSVSGQLGLDGVATNLVVPRGGDPISILWAVDLRGGNQVTGLVSTANWEAELEGDRAVFNSRSDPAPLAGNYTFVIPGIPDQPDKPEGDGFGVATVDAGGKVKFKGTLADGTKFSAGAVMSQTGMAPLYAVLYKKGGSILSWLSFDTNQPNDDVQGLLSWIRPPGPNPKSYTNGFELSTTLTGSLYLRPNGGSRVVELDDGLVVFSGGGLTVPSTNPVTIDATSKVTSTGPNKLTFKFTTSSGFFTGTLVQEGTTEKKNFAGAVLQKSRQGSGFFLREDLSGRVAFESEP